MHGEQTARPDADCTGIDDEGGKKYKLANAIDSLGDELASIVVSSLTKMFSQYWSHSMVFIDPSCDIDAGADTAAAFADLCGRFEVDCVNTQRELVRLQNYHETTTRALKDHCGKNLLRYYHTLNEAGKLEMFPHAKKVVLCVFSTPLTTVKVEPLFSVMG